MENGLKIHKGQFPDMTVDTFQSFREALPKIILFVNEKVGLEHRFAEDCETCVETDLVEQFNRDFGELLAGVFEFSLYPSLPPAFMELADVLENRGIDDGFIFSVLKSWILGIQCLVKMPAAALISAPVQWLTNNFHSIYSDYKTREFPVSEESGQFSRLILDRNRKFAAELLLGYLREGRTIEYIYSSVIMPALSYINFLWRKNRISSGDHYTATDICRYVMFRLLDSIFGERKYPFRAVVVCMPQEKDFIGAEMFANFLEIKGWSVSFFGRNSTEKDLLKAVYERSPQVVVVSVSSIACLSPAKRILNRIKTENVQLVVAAEGRSSVLAVEKIKDIIDVLVDGFDKAHSEMLNMVMKNAQSHSS